MLIDCDEGMVLALLRNWHPNRLQPQGVRLSVLRPKLIKNQQGVCLICHQPLEDDGKATHVDHIATVKDFLNKVLRHDLTFDDAYRQLWANSNVRAICRSCNYARKGEGAAVEISN